MDDVTQRAIVSLDAHDALEKLEAMEAEANAKGLVVPFSFVSLMFI